MPGPVHEAHRKALAPSAGKQALFRTIEAGKAAGLSRAESLPRQSRLEISDTHGKNSGQF